MICTNNVPTNVCVFCKFCYLLEEFLVCTYSLSSPLRLSAAGWWVDRIPIATKGGKTAAGKDQIIHYTQQQRGKRQKYDIKRKKAKTRKYTTHNNREKKTKYKKAKAR